MKFKDKSNAKKRGKFNISIVMYVVASVVALIGAALLINNILLFIDAVNQYVAQGYSTASVVSQLIPSLLLPGIFEPIGLYGGIAFVLLGVGVVNKKVPECLTSLSKYEVCNATNQESVLEQNVVDAQDADAAEQSETMEDVKKD